jgi:hypothetical protein
MTFKIGPSSPFQPSEAIVPLLAGPASAPAFLGTAFFAGPNGLLATAEHVLTDDDDYLIAPSLGALGLFSARVVERDQRHDLALLKVADYSPSRHLVPMFDQPFYPNAQVMTFEYGTTQTLGDRISINPATRLGNMTRQHRALPLSRDGSGVDALELSFPALRGASGAPIVQSGTNGVWGVIVANVSSELLPHQIEIVVDQKNQIHETTKFMLPLAIAVNINHLEPAYRRQTSGP